MIGQSMHKIRSGNSQGLNRENLARYPDNPIKVLYASLNLNLPGPLPKIEPLLTSALRNRGFQINRKTWGRHSEIETLPQKVSGRIGDTLKIIFDLVKNRPDILFVATTLDEYSLARDLPLLMATTWSPTKKVLMMHGSKAGNLVKPGNDFFKVSTKLLIQLSDAILLLSNEEMQQWTDFEPRGRYYRVENPFVRNGIPETKGNDFIKISKQYCPKLLFVGRLIKEKGIYELLKAMSNILKQTDCQLLIAGAGKEKEAIERQIEKSHLEQSVFMLGYLDSTQLVDVYRSATILILPTYHYEGFPTVITEAMSFGLPIVTTSIRGIPDRLKNGVNALFVKPKDSDGIAQAVIHLLRNPDLCLEMRQANLAKIQEFSPENVAPRYIDIFRHLLRQDEKENNNPCH